MGPWGWVSVGDCGRRLLFSFSKPQPLVVRSVGGSRRICWPRTQDLCQFVTSEMGVGLLVTLLGWTYNKDRVCSPRVWSGYGDTMAQMLPRGMQGAMEYPKLGYQRAFAQSFEGSYIYGLLRKFPKKHGAYRQMKYSPFDFFQVLSGRHGLDPSIILGSQESLR